MFTCVCPGVESEHQEFDPSSVSSAVQFTGRSKNRKRAVHPRCRAVLRKKAVGRENAPRTMITGVLDIITGR
jgi:hypothetical protein